MTAPARPLLAVVGGFLGAGKTTTIQHAAHLLRAEGLRVGIITNDQSSALVDSAVARQAGDVVLEIPDGCFCCRFDVLCDALRALARDEMPDVILAEAVGSCTDLAATVYQPLRQLTSDPVRLAPLTVVADGTRLRDAGMSGQEHGFPAAVSYLVERQLAEADVILLNKTDLLSPSERSRIIAVLASSYPGVAVVPIAAARAEGIGEWRALLMEDPSPGNRVLDLDYDRYAEAEASLGWMNLAGTVRLPHPGTAPGWLRLLLDDVAASAEQAGAEIAHLKAWIDTPAGSARGHVVGPGRSPDIHLTGAPAGHGRVLVNARVAVPPDLLDRWVRQAIRRASDAFSTPFQEDRGRAFSPPRPVPLHRLRPVVYPPSIAMDG